MPSPLVSVLIPCHNAEAFLKETLDSVMVQSGVSWELIVVDDGSTDGSAQIARAYGDKLRLISTPQAGASAARNLAASQASGEFFQFLDADDLLLPGALAARVAELSLNEGDVLVSDWQRLMPLAKGGFEMGRRESRPYQDWATDADLAVFLGFWAPPAAILYRASVARSLTWNTRLPVIQDARFLFDAALGGARFARLAQVTALYRQHAQGSLSSSSRLRFWRDIYTNTREIEALWQQAGKLQGRRLSEIAAAYASLTRQAFSLEKAFYQECRADLFRYPQAPRSAYLRWALRAERMLGYSISRALLGKLWALKNK